MSYETSDLKLNDGLIFSFPPLAVAMVKCKLKVFEWMNKAGYLSPFSQQFLHYEWNLKILVHPATTYLGIHLKLIVY